MSKINFNNIYNISKILNTDYDTITYDKNSNIYICVYNIIKEIPNRNIDSPYLKYLLYKYPTSKANTNNLLTFPFKKWDNKKNKPSTIADNLFKQLFNYDKSSNGFLNYKSNYYFFYNHENYVQENNILKKNNQLWWGLIDEICNHKKILYFPIHYETYSLFYNFPDLIYLIKNNKKCEIPSVSYFGNSIELLSYIATFGVKSNPIKMFGPYYYYGSFKRMIGHAGWHSNYTKREVFGKFINDENGKYKQGGIIRFALFLGNTKVILNRKKDIFNWIIKFYDTKKFNTKEKTDKFYKKMSSSKGLWTKYYDSLILGNIKYKNLSGYFNLNTQYITKNHNQQIPLSIHLLDMSSLKNNWDPTYDKYEIL